MATKNCVGRCLASKRHQVIVADDLWAEIDNTRPKSVAPPAGSRTVLDFALTWGVNERTASAALSALVKDGKIIQFRSLQAGKWKNYYYPTSANAKG